MAKKPAKATAKKSVKTKSTIKPDRTFLITGQVTDRQTGVGVTGLLVKVVDKDKQYEQFLDSTTTGEQGLYEITVDASKIGKHERGGPDIIVKVFDKQGTELAASEVVYNATAKTVINLSVTLHREPERSEYETLIVTLKPFLRGKQIVDHSNDEISTLAKESGIEQKRIELLVQGAKLSRETGLPTDALYGLACQDISLKLKSLPELAPNRVRTALKTSIKQNIVPASLADNLDEIMRQFEILQRRHMPIGKLAEEVGLDIPAAHTKVLEALNIRTLADIRTAGGLANMKKLNFKPDDPFVKKVDAHANLGLLSTDIPTNTVLYDEGFSHIYHIAKEPRDLFVKKMAPMLGAAKAERIQIIAKAQTALLDNHLTDWRVKRANGHDKNSTKKKMDIILEQSLPEKCGCEDCEAAVSPLAYLADLMGYAITGLCDNYILNGSPLIEQPISFDYLTKQFCQPFSDLPVACEQMYQEVRQVRLCIEVLRRYLNNAPELEDGDLSPSNLPFPSKLALAGDVDGDGCDEIVLYPEVWEIETRMPLKRSGFWVMDNDPSSGYWRHLSPLAGHPFQSDLDCSSKEISVKHAILADVDGDGRAELVAVPEMTGVQANDFWVMDFDVLTRTWRHLSPISGHPFNADVSCGGGPGEVKFLVAADIDGDGREEIIVAINRPGVKASEFWVMDYDTATLTWRHLSQIAGNAAGADFVCSSKLFGAKFAVVGDFDGDNRDEIAVCSDGPGSAGRDFWVMDYDIVSKAWRHIGLSTSGISYGGLIDEDILVNEGIFPYPTRFAFAADVDGDGRDELVIAPESDPRIPAAAKSSF